MKRTPLIRCLFVALIVMQASTALAAKRKADALHPYPGAGALRTTGDDWGQRMPDIVFFDETGKRHTLHEFRGDVVLVNLWASWCPPCIREVPSLQRLQAKFADKGLTVLLLNRWEDFETGHRWARGHGFTVPLHRSGEKNPERRKRTQIPTADGGTYTPAYTTIPTNILVGRGGTVLARLPSLNWDDFHDVIEDVLARAPAD